jgi:hypothetical protein
MASDFRKCLDCEHIQEAFDGTACYKCNGKTLPVYDCYICGEACFYKDLEWHQAQHWKGYEPASSIPRKYRKYLV